MAFRPDTTILSSVLVLALATLALLSIAQGQHTVPQPPQPRPSPNAPNPNFPAGLNGPAIKGPAPESVDMQNQAKLHHDVEKLYALAFVLREEMKVTNGTSTVSLTVVKQAQEIEKLAREIKERAKR